MTATKWIQVNFDDYQTKGHVVPASYYRPLIQDLSPRANTAHKIKPCPMMFMDFPGPCKVDRPVEDFRLYGLAFQCPSEDVAGFQLKLADLPLRNFEGRPYYKLHGAYFCLVLRPLHKVDLELQMSKRLVIATRRARAFYAEHDTPGTVLRKVAARREGIPLEQVPNLCDPLNADLYAPKERGQA
jgi:hypothetical protein